MFYKSLAIENFNVLVILYQASVGASIIIEGVTRRVYRAKKAHGKKIPFFIIFGADREDKYVVIPRVRINFEYL